ncbi:MAG TPA: hypothetical protein VEF04_20285 [Blastocatellia bacterium]|nr:hypothetical protein [Blastocatellia bacterium]
MPDSVETDWLTAIENALSSTIIDENNLDQSTEQKSMARLDRQCKKNENKEMGGSEIKLLLEYIEQIRRIMQPAETVVERAKHYAYVLTTNYYNLSKPERAAIKRVYGNQELLRPHEIDKLVRNAMRDVHPALRELLDINHSANTNVKRISTTISLPRFAVPTLIERNTNTISKTEADSISTAENRRELELIVSLALYLTDTLKICDTEHAAYDLILRCRQQQRERKEDDSLQYIWKNRAVFFEDEVDEKDLMVIEIKSDAPSSAPSPQILGKRSSACLTPSSSCSATTQALANKRLRRTTPPFSKIARILALGVMNAAFRFFQLLPGRKQLSHVMRIIENREARRMNQLKQWLRVADGLLGLRRLDKPTTVWYHIQFIIQDLGLPEICRTHLYERHQVVSRYCAGDTCFVQDPTDPRYHLAAQIHRSEPETIAMGILAHVLYEANYLKQLKRNGVIKKSFKITQESLAKTFGLSPKTVSDCKQVLIQLGELDVLASKKSSHIIT